MQLIETLVAVLAGSLALLATLHAGALVVLTLTHLSQHTRLSAATLKALQGALQGFVLTDAYLGHCSPSFRSSRLDISQIDRRMAKTVQTL